MSDNKRINRKLLTFKDIPIDVIVYVIYNTYICIILNMNCSKFECYGYFKEDRNRKIYPLYLNIIVKDYSKKLDLIIPRTILKYALLTRTTNTDVINMIGNTAYHKVDFKLEIHINSYINSLNAYQNAIYNPHRYNNINSNLFKLFHDLNKFKQINVISISHIDFSNNFQCLFDKIINVKKLKIKSVRHFPIFEYNTFIGLETLILTGYDTIKNTNNYNENMFKKRKNLHSIRGRNHRLIRSNHNLKDLKKISLRSIKGIENIFNKSFLWENLEVLILYDVSIRHGISWSSFKNLKVLSIVDCVGLQEYIIKSIDMRTLELFMIRSSLFIRFNNVPKKCEIFLNYGLYDKEFVKNRCSNYDIMLYSYKKIFNDKLARYL